MSTLIHSEEIEILSTIHIEDVAIKFLSLKDSGANKVCKCPICGTCNTFTINTSKQSFCCFACKGAMGKDAISFLIQTQKMDFISAVKYLKNNFKSENETSINQPYVI